ncbi:MAG: hypothetical protein IK144_09130 [Bacteroidaceae bacterium]|nr:hypothetical protein [Bacteroidaceae bacterium]
MRLVKLLFLVCCLSFALAIFCSAENPDVYYYMGCVRLLLEGKVPFVDFHIGYTPLSFYMACLPGYIFGTGNTAVLAFETFMSFINAGLIYYLLQRNVQDKVLCLFSTAFYLASLFFLDGMCYVLEPFIMFWGLLSLIAVQRKSLWGVLAAGICSFLAFWTKQYGLGFLVLNMLWIVLSFRSDWLALAKHMFVLLAGFALTACCMVGSLLLQGVTLSNMAKFSGSSYEKFGMMGIVEGSGYLLLVAPFLPVAVFLIVKHFKSLLKDTFLIVCTCGILGFMLATYVRPYLHYIQLPLPFALLLITILVDRYGRQAENERLVKWFKVSVIVPLCIMAVIDYYFIFHNERKVVNEVAAEVARLIPEGTKKVYVSTRLLCVGNINRYGAPMLERYGMSNGFMEEGEPLREIIMDADCYVIDPAKLEYIKREEPELFRHIQEGRKQVRIDCRDKRFVTIVFSNID